MIRLQRENEKLSAREVVCRLLVATGVSVAFLLLRNIDPTTVPLLALGKSCGALTGLPCIFCGTTRAVHHLLNGEIERAVYFNWLAFPVVFVCGLLAIVALQEALFRRRLVRVSVHVASKPRVAAIGVAALSGLWLLQVTLAVSLHKHELLNPAGLLYPFFVR